jgi:hypothetical protein
MIARCWSADPYARESFDEIVSDLERINFQIMLKVDSAKVSKYVRSVRQ